MSLATLQAAVQALSPSQIDAATATAIVNRCYMGALRKKVWLSRRISTRLNTVADKTTGTITLASGSTSVTGTGTAFAASDVGRYLYVAQDAPMRIATFVAASGVGCLTLTTAWGGTTITAQAYACVSLRYSLPSGTERVKSIVTQSWPLGRTSLAAIDAYDPTRRWRGPAFNWAEAELVNGVQEIELWPVPSTADSLTMQTVIRPSAVTPLAAAGDTAIIDETMVQFGAMAEACRMLRARTGDATWTDTAAMYQAEADKTEWEAKHEDSKAYGASRVVADSDSVMTDLSQFAALRQGLAYFQTFT